MSYVSKRWNTCICKKRSVCSGLFPAYLHTICTNLHYIARQSTVIHHFYAFVLTGGGAISVFKARPNQKRSTSDNPLCFSGRSLSLESAPELRSCGRKQARTQEERHNGKSVLDKHPRQRNILKYLSDEWLAVHA